MMHKDHDVLCMQASKEKEEFTWRQMLICRGDGKAREPLHMDVVVRGTEGEEGDRNRQIFSHR